MSKIFRLRVLVDTAEEKEIFRDIEINAFDNCEQLHQAIQDAFDFDGSQMASFYLSNEDWDKGEEIALMDVGLEEDGEIRLMKDTLLADIIENNQQKILYVFDFMLMWCFYIEVVSIEDAEQGVIYPNIPLTYGDSPDQYSKEPSDLFGAIPSFSLDGDSPDEGDDEEDSDL